MCKDLWKSKLERIVLPCIAKFFICFIGINNGVGDGKQCSD